MIDDGCNGGDISPYKPIIVKQDETAIEPVLPIVQEPIDAVRPVAQYDRPSFIGPIVRNPMPRYIEPDEAPIYAPSYDIRYWTVSPRDISCSEIQDENYPTAELQITGDMHGDPDLVESLDTDVATVSDMAITYGMKAGNTVIRVHKDGIYKDVKVTVTAPAGGGGVWLAYTGD